MESDEPLFSGLVGLIRSSEAKLREDRPDSARKFSTYVNSLYEYLFNYWETPADVNSRETDALFEVKHRYQNRTCLEEQERGWEGWNNHFLERILEAAKANKGARIIVVVGAEHSYWLRQKLRDLNGIRLALPGSVLE